MKQFQKSPNVGKWQENMLGTTFVLKVFAYMGYGLNGLDALGSVVYPDEGKSRFSHGVWEIWFLTEVKTSWKNLKISRSLVDSIINPLWFLEDDPDLPWGWCWRFLSAKAEIGVSGKVQNPESKEFELLVHGFYKTRVKLKILDRRSMVSNT